MIRSAALLFALVFLTATCVIVPLPVKAASRTIVVPDDYLTIASAIGNATNGDTIFVRNGTNEGELDKTLVIDKSISLIGESLEATLILHPKYSITWILTAMFFWSEEALQITAKDVTISNLTIKYTGDIRVSNKNVQLIETNLKTGSTETGLVINDSECKLIKNSLNGHINIQSSSNIVVENNFNSLQVDSGNYNIIDSNQLGYLELSKSDNNVVSNNNISTDLIDPVIKISNSSNNILSFNNVTSHMWNTNLNIRYASYNNTIYENNFFFPKKNESAYPDYSDNFYEKKARSIASVDLTAIDNFWEQNGKGNYWQGYNGSDSNWDGIGDTAYVIDAKNVDHYPLIAPSFGTKSGLESSRNLVVITTVSVVAILVVAGLLVYHKKHKHNLVKNS